MKLLVITHSENLSRKSIRQLYWGLAETTDLTVAIWEQMTTSSVRSAADSAGVDLANVDACMTHVKFRHILHEPFDWSGFPGLRVLYEKDAWLGYSPAHPRHAGTFAAVYHRDKFHIMISTGKRTAAGLRGEGVNAVWLPKGYDSSAFSDLGHERSGICTFGTMWPSRRALIARLGDAVTDVSGPYDELNERLNPYAGNLVCNMPGHTPLGTVGRAIRRWWPSLVRTWPGVEPMEKTFESAGAGCAPIVDHLDELEDLGFVNGETCLTYRTPNEATALIRGTDNDRLREIGAAAARLAGSTHTWRHRAEELTKHLER